MQNAGLDESQAGIKIASKTINKLRCVDDITLMAENEEELKSLLKRVKEEPEKAGLKLNIQKMKTMAFIPRTLWQTDGKKMETVSFKITADSDCNHEIKRRLLPGRKAMTNAYCVLKTETSLCQQTPYTQSYVFSCNHVWI